MTRAEADSIARNGGTDWVDEMLRTGGVHQLELSAGGGTEKVRYYLGGAYRSEDGFLKGNTYDRVNARLNLDADATKILRVGRNLAITCTSIDCREQETLAVWELLSRTCHTSPYMMRLGNSTMTFLIQFVTWNYSHSIQRSFEHQLNLC